MVGDQGLLDADRNLATAVLDKGLGAGLAGVVEADATILTPGGAYVGVEQIRTGLRPAANAGQLFWIPEKASSGASGDYGSTSGRYVQVLRGRRGRAGALCLGLAPRTAQELGGSFRPRRWPVRLAGGGHNARAGAGCGG